MQTIFILSSLIVALMVVGPCFVKTCGPVTSGTWGEWGEWSGCSQVCEGTRYRERFCTSDKYCKTEDEKNEKNETMVEPCNVNKCNGNWGSWSNWNDCYQCKQWRSRICFEEGKFCLVDDPIIEAQDSQVDRRSCENATCAQIKAFSLISSKNNTADESVTPRHENPP